MDRYIDLQQRLTKDKNEAVLRRAEEKREQIRQKRNRDIEKKTKKREKLEEDRKTRAELVLLKIEVERVSKIKITAKAGKKKRTNCDVSAPKNKKVTKENAKEIRKTKDRQRKRKHREEIRSHPCLHQKYKENEIARNQRRKIQGKLKNIADMTIRERNAKRKQWKQSKRKLRALKVQNSVNEEVNGHTNCPTSSIQSSISKILSASTPISERTRRRQKDSEISKQKISLSNSQRQTEKWKKRYFRLRNRNNSELRSTTNPTDIAVKIMGSGDKAVKKRLVFCEALVKQLENDKSNLSTQKEKRVFAGNFSGQILKKYRCRNALKHVISSYRCSSKYSTNSHTKSLSNHRIPIEIRNAIETFYERDDVCTTAPGKRDTMKRQKVTKRKRYLVDTVQNLYKKFLKETRLKLSQSAFYSMKPFWVIKPPDAVRDTCRCVKHANFEFMVQKLHKEKIITEKGIQAFAAKLCCDVFNKNCMYRVCSKCSRNSIKIPENDTQTWFYKWETAPVDRVGKKGQNFHVRICSKNRIPATTKSLAEECMKGVPKFFKHMYDAAHQYFAYSTIKSQLKPSEALIIIDFSENYVCKYHEEIQAVHFGASKKQLTLHTGVVYFKKPYFESPTCISFATVSESLRHDAPAIWAYLKPILEMLKLEVKEKLKVIHFQSDGPSTQYRNKTNFYLFASFCRSHGLEAATWNFSEAGHGKGPADGVGGTVKGLCDRAVLLKKKDIYSADDVVETINNSGSKTKIFKVNEEAIKEFDDAVPVGLKPVLNTMHIHQLVWETSNPFNLYLRSLSCSTCKESLSCDHFELKPRSWTFPNDGQPKNSRGKGKKKKQ